MRLLRSLLVLCTSSALSAPGHLDDIAAALGLDGTTLTFHSKTNHQHDRLQVQVHSTREHLFHPQYHNHSRGTSTSSTIQCHYLHGTYAYANETRLIAATLCPSWLDALLWLNQTHWPVIHGDGSGLVHVHSANSTSPYEGLVWTVINDTLHNHDDWASSNSYAMTGACGVSESETSSWASSSRRRVLLQTAGTTAADEAVAAAVLDTRYIDLLIVNAHERCTLFATGTGGGMDCAQDTAAIINLANAVYIENAFQPPLQLVLGAQVSFIDVPTPFTVSVGHCSHCASNEVASSDVLTAFGTWTRGTHTPSLGTYNAAHLFTALDFESNVRGLAEVGSICNGNTGTGSNVHTASAVGIIQIDPGQSTLMSALTFAHELGHNLGMSHDGTGTNTCPDTSFIMAAVSSFHSTNFSSCSLSEAHNTLATVDCLATTRPSQTWGTPVCGNGFVETGERCDCGSDAATCFSIDPCCDMLTCKLKMGAHCSNAQRCCRNCNVVPGVSGLLRGSTVTAGNGSTGTSGPSGPSVIATTCRSAASECDVPEYCDGSSSGDCPVDLHKGPGTDCTTATSLTPLPGQCWNGQCQSFAAQCERFGQMIGQRGSLIPCPLQTLFNNGGVCGLMYCAQSDNQVSCMTADDHSAVLADGTPCETGRQCQSNQCVASTSTSVFQWSTVSWDSCTSCDQTQLGLVQCRSTATSSGNGTRLVDASLCVPSARPATSRVCVNATIGCVDRTNQYCTRISCIGKQTLAWVLMVLGVLLGTAAFTACLVLRRKCKEQRAFLQQQP